MSKYTDYLKDLPNRISELIKRHFELEKSYEDSYEITLLLSLSFPLFNFTYEVIKCSSNYKGSYQKNAKDLKELLCVNICNDSTGIFKNVSNNWVYGINNIGVNQFYIESIESPISILKNNDNKICEILEQLRNSMSHASVKFKANDSNEIVSIMFISRKYENQENKINLNSSNIKIDIKEDKKIKTGYHIHEIPIQDFLNFINQFCKFLIKHKAGALILDMLNEESYENRA
jgi:hypothetical protein